MSKNRILILLQTAALTLALLLTIFLILFYSLAIIDMVNDGLMGPFIFVIFLVSISFTIIFLINRLLKG